VSFYKIKKYSLRLPNSSPDIEGFEGNVCHLPGATIS